MKPIVFITGASSGIGQSLAKAFIHEGYKAVLVARRVDVINDWATEQQLSANDYVAYAADVCDVDGILAAAKTCIAEVGLPDIVIANAGISIGIDTAIASDLETMRRVYATNNIGMAATFSGFINAMKTRGSGQLVGIASVAGIRG